MEQLLSNLISNALKFSGGGPAKIHLAVEEREKEWQVSVSDTGIGLVPEAADRIFVMFQRLHTEKEYPGTGIGLAICSHVPAAAHGEGVPGNRDRPRDLQTDRRAPRWPHLGGIAA
jgi:signal transduction histidine kinase